MPYICSSQGYVIEIEKLKGTMEWCQLSVRVSVCLYVSLFKVFSDLTDWF